MKPISIVFLFLFTAGVSIGQDISDGLLLDYSFNGTTEDQSGNNYDGIPFGMGYTTDRFGNPNSAASFDGVNDYVNFPNLEALKPELPVSFSFWIKYTSNSYQDRAVFDTSFEEDLNSGVFLTSSASTSQYALGFGNGSPFYNSSSIENYVSYGTIVTNEWTHISIVVTSASDMQIYINCEELDGYFGGSGGSLVYSSLPGCIGRHDQNTNSSAYYFKGAIDDFKYWSRALTAEEAMLLCTESNCNETLVIEDNQGCISTDLSYDFEFSGDSNNITEVLWTFSDGSTSNSQSPVKNYDSSGSFPFSLQVMMDDGCVYESEGNTVIYEAPAPPVLPDTISICEGEAYFLDFSEFNDWDQILGPNGNTVTSYLFDEIGVYNFSFIDVCGQSEESIDVIQTSLTDGLEIEGESEIVVCPNQPFSLGLGTNLSGNSYSWQPTTGLSDPNVLNPEITISEPVTYTLTATNPCTTDGTFELSVEIASPLDFILDSEVTICKGDTIEIPGTLNSPGDIQWNNSTTLSELEIPNPLAFPTSSTEYDVTISNECESKNESINVFVNDGPIISGDAQVDICAGDTAYANIQNVGNNEVNTWHWVATNSCGTDVFEVQLKTYVLDAILDLDSIICPDEPIELSAQGAATYTWFPTDAMDRPHDSVTTAHIYTDQLIQLQLTGGTCVKMFSDFVHVYHNIGFSKLDPIHLFPGQLYDLSPIESEYGIIFSEFPMVSFYSDTTMALIYTDKNGCEFSLYLPVIIEPTLYIPNSFTPDGDGLNDIFKAVGVNIGNFEMRIYNRYGKLVFETHSLNDGWNGGIDGYYCSDDIYNYVVEYSYHETEVEVKRGFVTLIR